MKILFCSAATFLLLCATLLGADKAQSLTGKVSDTMCGAKHVMAGMSEADCTRECTKAGSDYALVVGDKVYVLKGDKAAFDKFAGQEATVTGKVTGMTIEASSINAAKK